MLCAPNIEIDSVLRDGCQSPYTQVWHQCRPWDDQFPTTVGKDFAGHRDFKGKFTEIRLSKTVSQRKRQRVFMDPGSSENSGSRSICLYQFY